ncbi:MAG TPA: tRNA 2-thiouridine(34) synthase MnmA [Opitutales bacterium]|nr:tRNA 2-thiouridine(34) synthase MnmA [Opitutales bacterium]
MSKILVAMSGGVDSAVAALLLKQQGHDIAGAYMKNWINEEKIEAHCPWEEDIVCARAVCEKLGIDFTVCNFIRDYRERVVEYLIDGYKRGITPNPDVMCNREMKFGVLLDHARKNGFEGVATGHYARKLPQGAGFGLFEGADKNKDQSYFLAMTRREQLAGAFLPVGHLTKPELRELAAREGLPNAGRKDSQGICFIGEVKIGDFLRHYIPDAPGEIVDAAGKVLGEHRGLHLYTLGQRHGMHLPSNTDNEHYVVVGKDIEKNRLLVAFDKAGSPGLFQRAMLVGSFNWIEAPIANACEVEVRPRYRDPRVKARFEPLDAGLARVTFATPQRAIAPGQICAFHEGEKLLGGGVFVSPCAEE